MIANRRTVKWMLMSVVTLLCASRLMTVDASAAGSVEINETNFPDATFRAYISDELDEDSDGVLSAAEISSVQSMDVTMWGIADLRGIGFFTELKVLDCSSNSLETLDLSGNTALTELLCDDNLLTDINVSSNTALTELYCVGNQLSELDISNNAALDTLDCSDNALTALDVSNNTALTTLVCYTNLIESLDISNNKALITLDCASNQLELLELNDAVALKELTCNDNLLGELDVSANTALTQLICGNNQLSALDVSSNTALTGLNCSSNQLTELDVSSNTLLKELDCSDNAITSLNLTSNTVLGLIRCQKNQLASLNTGSSTELSHLYCAENQLTSLDVSQNSGLVWIDCRSNQLVCLDVSSTNVIEWLYCSSNVHTMQGYSLAELSKFGFDAEKASNWSGAVYDEATNSLIEILTGLVTYNYDVGNGLTVSFRLQVPPDIKPYGLTATAGDGVVSLVWETPFTATRYAVYTYTQDAGYKLIGTTTRRAYAVSGLTNGTAYGFLVRGYGGGIWSEYTKADIVYATPVGPEPVDKPEITSLTPGDGTMILIWSKPEGAIKYAVYTYLDNRYTLIGTTSKNAYIISGLTNGTSYGFLVRACGTNGLWSTYTRADNVYAAPVASVAVGKPEITTITPGDGTMALIWSAPEGAIKYAVYTYTREGGYTLIGTTSKNAYVISGLTNGTSYGFLVRACGSNGVWSEYTKADNVYATPTA